MSFLRFLTLLPQLINALAEVYKIFKDVEVQKWMSSLDEAILEVKEAKDEDSKRLAAIKLRNVMLKL